MATNGPRSMAPSLQIFQWPADASALLPPLTSTQRNGCCLQQARPEFPAQHIAYIFHGYVAGQHSFPSRIWHSRLASSSGLTSKCTQTSTTPATLAFLLVCLGLIRRRLSTTDFTSSSAVPFALRMRFLGSIRCGLHQKTPPEPRALCRVLDRFTLAPMAADEIVEDQSLAALRRVAIN